MSAVGSNFYSYDELYSEKYARKPFVAEFKFFRIRMHFIERILLESQHENTKDLSHKSSNTAVTDFCYLWDKKTGEKWKL